MANKGAQPALSATEKCARPGDYELGSPQSRAAARAMIVEQISKRDTLTILMSSFIPDLNITEPSITEWREGQTASCIARHIFPLGMTLEEAQRISLSPDGSQTFRLKCGNSLAPWCLVVKGGLLHCS